TTWRRSGRSSSRCSPGSSRPASFGGAGVVTAGEIRGVTIFAGLDEADCDRLARVAADLALSAGEYAAEQGSDRALFAVLAGRIEAVRLSDGAERVVGERKPGDIFGEVPIT